VQTAHFSRYRRHEYQRRANERRRALALEAYDVVTDRLARNPNVVPLTDDEEAVISQLHQNRQAPRPLSHA
jgi:hypothetical protein